jgi:hypothetical protein
VTGQFHAPAALTPGKQFPVSIDTRLEGPLNQSGHCGEEKNLLPLPGIKPQFLGCPAHSYMTEEKPVKSEKDEDRANFPEDAEGDFWET